MIEKSYVFAGRKDVFIEHRFRLGLNRISNCLKICRIQEGGIFNEKTGLYAGYRSNAGGLNGFGFSPMGVRNLNRSG